MEMTHTTVLVFGFSPPWSVCDILHLNAVHNENNDNEDDENAEDNNDDMTTYDAYKEFISYLTDRSYHIKWP